ncbi:hypothetical protein LTR37_013039 [Vermiconidia calcicola]|uniref:Uncharacterized protein n=1 Tax=Vermiconidia calcicola TaxID=1690605 RepID=A0ACC3MXK5_9PEZI|nr:hypothetical protein LTR37_013039 [Vermiconidia calcicola]
MERALEDIRSHQNRTAFYLALTHFHFAMFRPQYEDDPEDDDYYLPGDPRPGMGGGYDPLEEARIQEQRAVDEGAAQPNYFHEYRNTLTPPMPGSPLADYMPGPGEPYSPTVMGRQTRDFAAEMNLPFEEEDHRWRDLGDDEYISTLPPAAINEETYLHGMYDNDFRQHSSLLMEPVAVNPQRFGGGVGHEGWPEGAIDYVGQRLGRSELEENWDGYSKIGGEHITPEYIANKEADPSWSPPESAFWEYDRERGLWS